MGYAFEGKQKVIDSSELSMAINNLSNAIKTGNYNEKGWSDLKKVLKNHTFSEKEQTHFLNQVKLMLKLWGTGSVGKRTVSAITEKCLKNETSLMHIGLYVQGTEIKNKNEKRIGVVSATNPVVQWIKKYRKDNGLGIELDVIPQKQTEKHKPEVKEKEQIEQNSETKPEVKEEKLIEQKPGTEAQNQRKEKLAETPTPELDTSFFRPYNDQSEMSDILRKNIFDVSEEINEMRKTDKDSADAFIEYVNSKTENEKTILFFSLPDMLANTNTKLRDFIINTKQQNQRNWIDEYIKKIENSLNN